MNSMDPAGDLLAHVSDPTTSFTMNLDGMTGSTPTEMVENAIARGRMAEATGQLERYGRTNWEMYRLREAGRVQDDTFRLNGRPVEVEVP